MGAYLGCSCLCMVSCLEKLDGQRDGILSEIPDSECIFFVFFLFFCMSHSAWIYPVI